MSAGHTTKVDAGQVQHIVLCAPRAGSVRHLIVNMGERPLEFLQHLLKEHPVDTAAIPAEYAGPALTSLGITFSGLAALRTFPLLLNVFRNQATAFSQGAPARAASKLGDTGPSSPTAWMPGFAQEKAHLLVSIHGDSNQVADKARAVGSTVELRGGSVLTDLGGAKLKGKPDEVHFGYRDGLSRIRVKGFHGASRGSGSEGAADKSLLRITSHEPGEFLLGYRNDAGYNPWFLGAYTEKWRSLFTNGSFGVFRVMEQHVEDFMAFIDEAATQMKPQREEKDPGKAAEAREVLKQEIMAKLCGRWPDGRPLVEGFDFSTDRHGEKCPFGAHIRRMNPPPGDGVVHANPRPLIRRGLPYGAPYGEGPDVERRGLLGLFFCASIEQQFEHLVGQWGERVPLGSPDGGTAKDPFFGHHADPQAGFEIRSEGGHSHQLRGLRPFVTTRGTLYAFYPSLQALELLKTGEYLPPEELLRAHP